MQQSSSHLNLAWPAVLPRPLGEPRPAAALWSAAGVSDIGRHVISWVTDPGSLLSGVLVALVAVVARSLWHRWHVPAALPRTVLRRNYLRAVYDASRRPGIERLDVLAPRLKPARGNAAIARILAAWEQINKLGKVRVLIRKESLQAGTELMELGFEVRVAPWDLYSDDLSCHLFDPHLTSAHAIINEHQGDSDRPGRIKGALVRPYRNDFKTKWAKAKPLESVVAEDIEQSLPDPGPYGRDMERVLRSVQQASERLNLHERGIDKIRPHLAFRDSARVVFIVGPPGSGKSYVRCRLAAMLRSKGIECQWLTDYQYAFRDMLCGTLQMIPAPRNGFKTHRGGAFVAHDEETLQPALRAVADQVRKTMQDHEVTLVEFARSELVAAFREFDEVRCRCQVIHVSAPAELRLARIGRRARPPEVSVRGEEVVLKLSDDHLLPSRAARTLYAREGIDALRDSALWRDKIFEIDNRLDGEGYVDKELGRFLDRVIAPYGQAMQAPLSSAATSAGSDSRGYANHETR